MNSSDLYVDPRHRFNVNKLYNFIPIITLSDFKKRCHSNIDVVFKAREMTKLSYQNINENYGLKLPSDDKFYEQSLNSSKMDTFKVG